MADQVTDQDVNGIDKQKQYLVEKFGSLIKQIGDGYGAPLQEELIRRLEKTVAEFHEEVTDLISDLKKRAEQRHEILQEIWTRGEEEVLAETEPKTESETEETKPEEASEWERRIEEKYTKTSDTESNQEPEAKEKKKGVFGRKKK